MAAARKLPCAVQQVVAHGDRVYSVTLAPRQPAPRFRAGQFLHLTLDPYDPTAFWPDSRVFSIASGPRSRDVLRLTYSVHGPFTERMERELAVGREVWVKMPYGDFSIEGAGDIVLLAGGTGITAFTAYLDELEPSPDRHVTLAYGARHAGLLVYRALVERAVVRTGRLSALYFVEQADNELVDTATMRGVVSIAAVWDRLPRPLDAQYYIAGPQPMIRTIEADLLGRGVAASAIHVDAWE